MKKLLWCGGSHLANSKNAIESNFSEFDNIFFRTAGPVNLEWFRRGGRYKVDRDLVLDPRDEKQSFRINQYVKIIFVGQYINIRRYHADNILVSRTLYETIYPHESAPFILGRNHPLELFFKKFGNKCILLPEPIPISNDEDAKIPLRTHDFYRRMLWKFCSHYDSTLIGENFSFLGKDGLTLSIYKGRDSRHCNSRYWDIRMQDVKKVFQCPSND
jgi:hypothetical protein